MKRQGRPFKLDEVPAEAIVAAYLDETLPLAVSAARLGLHPTTVSKRARLMELPQRRWVRAERLEGVGVSARVADAPKGAAGQVLETPARRLGLPAVTGETR